MLPARCQGRGTTQRLYRSEADGTELWFAAGRPWLQALALPGWFPHIGVKHGEELVSPPLR